MAYRINDEIFFLKIDEQVEYLTQVINELYSKDIKIINTNINNLSTRINNLNETKQDKTSGELKTEVKNIVGSINELFDKIESETNRAVNSENEISTNLTEYENHVNPILDSHTSSISSINDSIRSLQDNKQSKIDEQLQTTSKEIVGAINENHDAIVTNEALIDTKQDKTDNSLETTNKTIVGAINEVNNKIFTDENIDEIKKELNNKANKTDVYTKTEVDNSLNLKLDKASVLQATGTSTTATISQKVITDQLSTKFNKSDSSYYGFIATSVVVTTAEAVTTKTLPKTMRNNNYHVFVSPVSSAFNGVIPSWNVPSKTKTSVSIYFKYGGPYDILICEL